jgi:DNA-binding SARP family transcriptional activator
LADFSFAVLGPLAVHAAGTPVRVRGAKRRIVLATLLLRPNRTVSVAELVERVWGGGDPDAHRGALQVQVTRLRAVLEAAARDPAVRGPRREPPMIVGGLRGYRIELDPHQLDLLRFRALVRAAGDAQHRADPGHRFDLLGRALDLWQPPLLADLASPVLHRHDVEPVREEVLRAAVDRCHAALALGRPDQVLGMLGVLTDGRPEHETLVRLRMIALYRCGRQSEALEVYERTRRVLAERLGVDPGRPLQEAFHGVLRGDLDDRPSIPRPRPAAAPYPRPGRAVPAQLPAAPSHFTGRAAELALLDRLAGPDAAPGRALISGPPGAGSTALALHWAHRVAGAFPDGQLYVDLRGDSGRPLTPDDVLRRFLRALHVGGMLPAEVDERAALLRSVLADRRVLLLLDNARSADQVRPLLPGASGCGAVVTSRSWLADLIVREGVPAIPLGELRGEEAAGLLAALVGPERAAAEPAALRRLADAAERLPLPLRMAAAWLATHPESTAAALADAVAQRPEPTAPERMAAALHGDPRFLMGAPGCRGQGGHARRE